LLKERENVRRFLALAVSLFIFLPMLFVFTSVKAQTGGNSGNSNGISGGSLGEDYPISTFTDFQNGTTLTVIDYGNGTLDETIETLTNKTATLDVLNDESNQSISLLTSEQEHTSYKNSTQTAMMEQQLLMGFTYEIAKYRWQKDWSTKVWFLQAYVEVGINVDIEFGLRLPVNITVEYPEQMTVGRNYTLYATITPIDKPNFNEGLCVFKAYVWAEAGVWSPLTGWVKYYAEEGPNYDLSQSFKTPLGHAIAFPISPIYKKVFEADWVCPFDFLDIYLGGQPGFGSDKVTAVANATGDGKVVAGSYMTWTAPGQRLTFTVLAKNLDPTTNYANISISNFRYYFTNFYMRFWLKFDFNRWISWLTGNPEIPIYTLDLSWLIKNLNGYLGTHPGYPNSVNVDLFVKNYGVQIIQIKPSVANIKATESALFEVSILNTGSVNDTFDFSLQGVPNDWQYAFSKNHLNMTRGNMTKSYLTIKPPAGLSQGHFSYNLTVSSIMAPLDGLVATDLKTFAIDISPQPPPQIQVLSPQNTTYATNIIALNFAINKPSAWIGYNLDNSGNVTIAGNTTLTGLNDGSHKIVVFANDSLGSMGSSGPVYFSVRIPVHDIAVIDVVPSATQVFQGEVVNVAITVKNNGTEPETFNVKAYYDNTAIGIITNVFLNPSSTKTLTFSWNTSTVPLGNHNLKGEASQVPNEVNINNNIKINGMVSIQQSSQAKFHLIVDVTDNKGNPISNAAVYCDQESKLTDGGFVEFTLTKGNYTINACKQGYQVGSASIYLDQNMTLDFILSPIQFPTPVGGYARPIEVYTTPTFLESYTLLVAILAMVFTTIGRKTRRETK
jgi:hypothetical protein